MPRRGVPATYLKVRRWLVRVGVVLLGLEALYLLAANVLLNSGAVPRWVSAATPQVRVAWQRAITLWPGHATVKGFSMQFDDGNMVQMDLNVDDSTVDVSLLALTRRTFRLNHGRATGVSYRMTTRVSEEEAKRFPGRIAAFPKVPGFDFPPLRPKKLPPPATKEDIERLWRIDLARVESHVREVWIDEYRYVGDARVKGSFQFAPMKELSVGPASVSFEGGRLTAGEHVLFESFEAKVRTTIAKADVSGPPDRILPKLTASVHTRSRLESLGAIGLYVDGVDLKGGGPLELDVEIVNGKIRPVSAARVQLERLRGRAMGMKFDGASTIEVGVSPSHKPFAKLVTNGRFSPPAIGGETIALEVKNAKAEAWLTSADLAAPPRFGGARASLEEARADDVRPLVKLAGKYVPVIAPAVLGEGPLTVQAKAKASGKRTVITLEKAQCGAASLTGAVAQDETGWNGAAHGKFDLLSLALKLDETKFGFEPIAGDGWLAAQLERAGIEGDEAPSSGRSAPSQARRAPR